MARNHYNGKDAQALAILHIEAKKKALSLVPAVAEVLRKFDGKQANKRLDTALKKVNDNLTFKMSYNSFIVEWHIDKRGTRAAEQDYHVYIDDYHVTLLHAGIQSYARQGEGILDTGTINAELAIKHLEKYAASIKEGVEKAEQQLEQVEEILAERERLKKQIEQHNDEISYLLNGYFNLKIETGRY